MHEQFGDSSTPLRFAQNDRRVHYASLGVAEDFI